MQKAKSSKVLNAPQVFKTPNENRFAEVENIVEYLRENKANASYVLKYRAFTTFLLTPEIKDSLLVTWLKQFKDNILFLDKENEEITSCLLHLDWARKSPEVVSVYQDLMLNMISAHPYYLRRVLEMLIKFFHTGDDGTVYVTEKEKELFSKGHHLVKEIVTLIPMSPTLLYGMLLKNYPYVKKDVHLHTCYATNILEMCSYLLPHRQTLMEGLIMHLLQMDVSCPRQQIEMDELDNSDIDEKTFLMDHHGANITEDQERMSNPLANTLDVLMDCFFQYIQRVCCSKDGKGLKWDSTKKLFKEILVLFDKVILSTHGSAHVQFILFYLCSLKPDLYEAYIDYLWKKVQNPNTAPALRQAAAFYIGSFLARASYVTIRVAAACLELMCLWIHRYIDAQCFHNYADIAAHGTFYAVCQVVFYVFAFRHREFIEMKRGLKMLRNLNFERIISCRLNPLKVCPPAVVQNFASVTRSYQLAYCYTVIDKNNRNVITCAVQSSNDSKGGDLKLVILPTLFPFDPYLLKRSKKRIEPIYRVYNGEGIEPMDDQDEDFGINGHSSTSPRKQSFENYGSSLSSRPIFSLPKS